MGQIADEIEESIYSKMVDESKRSKKKAATIALQHLKEIIKIWPDGNSSVRNHYEDLQKHFELEIYKNSN
jgi:hypothetical protein